MRIEVLKSQLRFTEYFTERIFEFFLRQLIFMKSGRFFLNSSFEPKILFAVLVDIIVGHIFADPDPGSQNVGANGSGS